MIRRTLCFTLLLLLPLLFTSGCAVTGLGDGKVSLGEHELLFKMSTKAAVGRLLYTKPAWTEPTIRIVGNATRFIDENTWVNLAELETYIVDQVPWKEMLPEEQMLVRELITVIRVESQNYFNKKGVPPLDQIIAIKMVLEWVLEAAEFRRDHAAQGGRRVPDFRRVTSTRWNRFPRQGGLAEREELTPPGAPLFFSAGR
jgi:hypothetical protein